MGSIKVCLMMGASGNLQMKRENVYEVVLGLTIRRAVVRPFASGTRLISRTMSLAFDSFCCPHDLVDSPVFFYTLSLFSSFLREALQKFSSFILYGRNPSYPKNIRSHQMVCANFESLRNEN